MDLTLVISFRTRLERWPAAGTNSRPRTSPRMRAPWTVSGREEDAADISGEAFGLAQGVRRVGQLRVLSISKNSPVRGNCGFPALS